MLRFPLLQDLRLAHAPLAEVIFQVRFPPVLRIIGQQPVEFQERLREQFPLYQQEEGVVLHVGPSPVEPAMQPQVRVFRFTTLDEKTTISLAADFYSVSTTDYKHWSDFVKLISLANSTVCNIYNLAISSRIGLRYVNRLTFSNSGAKTLPELWALLRPEMTALLRQDCWDAPTETLSQLTAENVQGEFLTLRSGFRNGEAPHLILDLDYYSDGKSMVENVTSHIERFHSTIYAAFRWCLSPQALDVFGPIDPQRGS